MTYIYPNKYPYYPTYIDGYTFPKFPAPNTVTPSWVKDMTQPLKTEKPTGGSNDYYKIPEGAKELQDLIEAQGMSFAIGNIFKAAYRLGKKPGVERVYDLEKIIWFAQRELELAQKEINP